MSCARFAAFGALVRMLDRALYALGLCVVARRAHDARGQQGVDVDLEVDDRLTTAL